MFSKVLDSYFGQRPALIAAARDVCHRRIAVFARKDKVMTGAQRAANITVTTTGNVPAVSTVPAPPRPTPVHQPLMLGREDVDYGDSALNLRSRRARAIKRRQTVIVRGHRNSISRIRADRRAILAAIQLAPAAAHTRH